MSLFQASNVPVYLVAYALSLILIHKFAHNPQRTKLQQSPLPPGPKPLPFVGNIFDVPSHLPWVVYRDMCAQFGDLIHLDALGQHIIVVGNTNIASDLFEKRSANYSDRAKPRLPVLIGAEWILGLIPYGQWWRRHRRGFWQHFHPGVVHRHRPTQRQAVLGLLKRLLDEPARLIEHIRFTFGASILKVVYDIDVHDARDPILLAMETSMAGISEFLLPGASILEFLPWLKYLPRWLPFQRRLASLRAASMCMKMLPYAKATSEEPNTRSEHPSILQALMNGVSPSEQQTMEIAQDVAGVAYAAGADTSISALQAFFLAMSLSPDAQRRAQAELDTVVGTDRLPEFADRDSLPYVNALIKEVTRWHVITPVGIPHASLEDDEYGGYFIPAGSIVIPNTWAMLHDPSIYPEPERFMPERFMSDRATSPPQPDPTIAFGYGRRICPGRYFADSALFITIASVLHAFEITPPLDEKGAIVEVEPKMTSTFVSYPEDCRCTIKPRSARSIELVNGVATPTPC